MLYNEFAAEQYNAHREQAESRTWDRTCQQVNGNDWNPIEVAPLMPALSTGSFADSQQAIWDQDRYWSTLASIFTIEQIQAMKENFES